MTGDAAAEALGMVAAVRDDPALRLELASSFYDGLPAYAWTNDENHPWTTTRSRRLRSVLGWMTS